MRVFRKILLRFSAVIHIPALAANRETAYIHKLEYILDKWAEYCRRFLINL